MQKILTLLLFFFVSAAAPAFADQTSAPQKEQDEQLPETFKLWEQQNAPRDAAEETRYGELWTKTLTMLVIILLILFAGTWYLKRFGGFGRIKDSGQNARIQLLEKRVISPKAVIYLLSIDGHKIALSETSSGIQVLQELTRHPKPFSLEQPPTPNA